MFAGIATTDSVPNVAAATGAVPSVAAVVSATASATPAERPAASSRPASGAVSTMIARTAAKLSLQPGSSMAAGSSDRVRTTASNSACQRSAGRDASAATTLTAPMIPARWIDAPDPAKGTYTAIARRSSAIRPPRRRPSSAPSAITSDARSAMLAPLAATR